MKFKKESVKPFILGFITALVIGGLVFGGIKLVQGIKKNNAKREYQEKEDNKSETIDGITYTIVSDNKSDIVCDAFKDVKYSNHNYFITQDGFAYALSEKKYSTTKQNCKLLDDKIKFKSVINGALISTDNGKYYVEYNRENEIILRKSNEAIREIDLLLKSNAIYADGYDSVYDEKTNIEREEFIALKGDGKLYNIFINNKFNSYTGDRTYNIAKEELFKSFDDETIKSFRYEKDSENGYILTDKGVYVQTITNLECREYEDIKCEYNFVKDKYLSKYANQAIKFDYENSYRFDYANVHITTTDSKTIQIDMRRKLKNK